MNSNQTDILIIGAGPAGLATAIETKKLLNEKGLKGDITVIDKAPRLGYHNLSGSVIEGSALDELLPEWKNSNHPFVQDTLKNKITRDDLYYLRRYLKIKIPGFILPKNMKHKGDYAVSVSRLSAWLGEVAIKLGVEIYNGFAASELIIEDNEVKGVILAPKGLDREGNQMSNYLPEEKVFAKITILAEGSDGNLSNQLIEHFKLAEGKNPQVYSIGVKQLFKLPENNSYGKNRAVHTLGYPNRFDVFGGGFMYDMGNNILALGVILGLDWRYNNLDPQQELELLKKHPVIKSFLKGSQLIAAGVKTIPEGGYYALPNLYADRAMLVGDAAGFVNISKFKGIHLAIRSGMCAAKAIANAVEHDDFSSETLSGCVTELEKRGVIDELFRSRNFRQVFATRFGILLGMPLSLVQHLIPFRLGSEGDFATTKKNKLHRKYRGEVDGKAFVGLSGAMHNEELLPHISVINPNLCIECFNSYGAPCKSFCPAKVYSLAESAAKGSGKFSLIISSADCMHCKTCVVKCPYKNIRWTPPVDGQGPRYKQL